jgi:hypothetical protein
MVGSILLLFLSNIGTACAYAMIGSEIVYFYRVGKPIFRSRRARMLFATFIPACGLTHAVYAANIWSGQCAPGGVSLAMSLIAEVGTAIVSLATAFLLPSIARETLAAWEQERIELIEEIRGRRTWQ